MVQARLAGTIRKCLQRRDTQSIDTTNIDNPARITVGGSFLEEWCEKLRNLENALEVQGEHPSPRRRGIFIIRCSPI